MSDEAMAIYALHMRRSKQRAEKAENAESCQDCEHYRREDFTGDGPDIQLPRCDKARDARERGIVLIPSWVTKCRQYFKQRGRSRDSTRFGL